MDIRKVKKLIELMEESDITEMEVREGDDMVRICRGGAPSAVPATAPAPAAATAAPVTHTIPAAAAPAVPEGEVLPAPMVGTFYRAPAPGADPFVDTGQDVKEGDTLCIIESMKMMNHIKAERAGRIVAILVENEEPVEFDQPLFVLD